YSPSNSALYMDGQVVANGSGVSLWPGPAVRTNGFAIGSDLSGTNVAQGTFENFKTWADPFPEGFSVTNHQNALIARYNPNGVGGGGNGPSFPSGGGLASGSGAFSPLPGLELCLGNGL